MGLKNAAGRSLGWGNTEGGFRRIPIASLRLDSIPSFDIYTAVDGERGPVLYREKNLPITGDVLTLLEENRHEFLYIATDQEREYLRYTEANLDGVLADDSVPVEQKSQVIYSCAQGLVSQVLEEPRSRELIQRSRDLVQSTTNYMVNEKAAFSHLLKLVSYDYYTYTHSVNVFVFSVTLAQRVGFTDPDLLREYGEGVLLHDIGKSLIDPSITNCKGRLSAEQWESMRMHPVYGYDIMREHGTLSEMALGVVRHHHEKIRGGGYPDDLKGKQIEPLVRISTIADIFDALTTRRSYKDALGTFEALTIMRDEISRDLDEEYFRAFVAMMGNPDG
jgi:HD-GYP domain-containing protein (c-di-GMP phosphodiesterase class II)